MCFECDIHTVLGKTISTAPFRLSLQEISTNCHVRVMALLLIQGRTWNNNGASKDDATADY